MLWMFWHSCHLLGGSTLISCELSPGSLMLSCNHPTGNRRELWLGNSWQPECASLRTAECFCISSQRSSQLPPRSSRSLSTSTQGLSTLMKCQDGFHHMISSRDWEICTCIQMLCWSSHRCDDIGQGLNNHMQSVGYLVQAVSPTGWCS
jgi:hypothetical protein